MFNTHTRTDTHFARISVSLCLCVFVAASDIMAGGKRLFTLLLHICMQAEMYVVYLCQYVCLCANVLVGLCFACC